MLPYTRIADTLDQAYHAATRVEKVEVLVRLLESLHPEVLRPSVRLLLGGLWPSWEPRQMGVGPETVQEALAELSGGKRYEDGDDLGSLAEVLVRDSPQRILFLSPSDAIFVYETLRLISEQGGVRSLHRKKALLKGLLLNATPSESKYIVRAVLGKMNVGVGPSLMLEAISKTFGVDQIQVQDAYARLPELGMIALTAARKELAMVKIAPPIPVRLMIMGRANDLHEATRAVPRATYVVRYGGLRLQVHKIEDKMFFYTNRLRNVSLRDLAEDAMDLKGDLVMEGELILTVDGKMQPFSELVRYINRKDSPRRAQDGPGPSLMVTDLLYQDGEELVHLGYAHRQKRLIGVLGDAKEPFSGGIALAEERFLESAAQVEEWHRDLVSRGFGGLVMHDLDAPYALGSKTERSLILAREIRMPDPVIRSDEFRSSRTEDGDHPG